MSAQPSGRPMWPECALEIESIARPRASSAAWDAHPARASSDGQPHVRALKGVPLAAPALGQLAAGSAAAHGCARRATAKCERLYLGERDRRRDDGLGHRHRHLGRVHARRERANLERIRAGKEGNSNASLVQHFDSLCTEHNHDASGGDPRADGPGRPLRRQGMVGDLGPTWGWSCEGESRWTGISLGRGCQSV